MTSLTITRKVEQDKEIQAREIVRDGDYSLVHSDEFGYEIVYQNGNRVADIENSESAPLLRLWCRVALHLFEKLDNPIDPEPETAKEVEG